MGITESEQERFDRARRRIMDAGLDDLTVESTSNALSLSEAALNKAAPDIRLLAEAVAGQAVAFAHFISGAQKAAQTSAATVAATAIARHAAECVAAGGKPTKTSFIDLMKVRVTGTPMAASIFASVCVFVFRDKIFTVFFGG